MTNRINAIIQEESYQTYLAKTEAHEKDRVFCHHDMAHFLDVARIAVILNEKEQYGLDWEVIYAAALLHDIGRWQQYETGEDHALASANLAGDILKACGFTDRESRMIISAIATHRDESVKEKRNLNGVLYRADKFSRPCFACKQQTQCNWKGEKKNLRLQY